MQLLPTAAGKETMSAKAAEQELRKDVTPFMSAAACSARYRTKYFCMTIANPLERQIELLLRMLQSLPRTSLKVFSASICCQS